jgi:hypothetical protein
LGFFSGRVGQIVQAARAPCTHRPTRWIHPGSSIAMPALGLFHSQYKKGFFDD